MPFMRSFWYASRIRAGRHRLPAVFSAGAALRLNNVSTALALGNTPAGELAARGASGLAAPSPGAAELTEGEFHEAADALLDAIECVSGALDDTITDGFDVSNATGVLTLALGSKGTYVLNKQAPNRQVWWSSPISGPKRYHWDAARRAWLNTRDGHALTDLLAAELQQLTGVALDFSGGGGPPRG